MPFCLSDALAMARQRGWPLIMGIVNVTPDSFSDGGRFHQAHQAVTHGLQLLAEGADILDVGGESTRPGAGGVSAGEELERVAPVIEGLRRHTDLPISIDTSKAQVMAGAISRGANLINDVRALRETGAMSYAVRAAVPVVLMHMLGEPRTMQNNPSYHDVVTQVRDFLLERVRSCERAGLPRERLLIDPGIGFGKSLDHNLSLLKHLHVLCSTGLPVLVGASRKAMLAAITARDVDERAVASVGVAVHAARAGAAVVRVHDVAATLDGLKVNARIEHAC